MAKHKKRKESDMELVEWGKALAPYLFNWKLLENRLTTSTASIEQMVTKLPNGSVYRDPKNKGVDNPYLFIDNGAHILGVAHLDATGNEPHFYRTPIRGQEWILSRWVDDRLGVFLLLDVLPHFFNYDILLTTGEETAKSSALLFDPPMDGENCREYNWMFEPDRMGTDVVHYQFYNNLMRLAVLAAGFTVYTSGAYSDISSLAFLGCCGINFGIGYEDNHSDWARANLNVTLEQTAKFCRFFETNQELVYPYTPKVATPVSTPAANSYPLVASGGREQWFEARYHQGQIVKEWLSKKIGMVTTKGWWEAKAGRYVYWCMFRDPDNHNQTTHRSVNENDLSGYFGEKELPHLWELYPNGLVWDWNSGKGRSKPDIAKPEVQRTDLDDFADMRELNKINEGNPFDPEVKLARQEIELAMYGTWLQSSSYDIPWQDSHYLDFFHYGEEVFTNDRRGSHKGSVDCEFPIMVHGEGDYWWVRFQEKDALGLTVDLVHGPHLTLVPRPLQEVLPGLLPAVDTRLGD